MKVLAVLLSSLAASSVVAEHPVEAAQRHQQEANAAYLSGDYAGFTRSLERARELNPASFATMYNLACGYARTGRPDDALDLLEQLTVAQVDFGMANDPDLASLRDNPRFQELVRTLAASIVPVSNSTERLAINQLGLAPEGIALPAIFSWLTTPATGPGSPASAIAAAIPPSAWPSMPTKACSGPWLPGSLWPKALTQGRPYLPDCSGLTSIAVPSGTATSSTSRLPD
jgi:hypothetical protein